MHLLFEKLNLFKVLFVDDVHKSPNPCSLNYAGSRPFSTPEAQAIRAYIDSLGDIVQMSIHLHASFKSKKVNKF